MLAVNECFGVGFHRTYALDVVYSVIRVTHIEGLLQSDLSFFEHGHIKRPLRGMWDAPMQESVPGLFRCRTVKKTMAVYDISPNTHL